MKNSLGRPGGDCPFEGAFAHQQKHSYSCSKMVKPHYSEDFKGLFNRLPLHDGMTVSFHHHLRNGDFVLNMVMAELAARGIRGITVAATSIFPCHEPLVELMAQGVVTKITTSYVSGPVAEAMSRGALKEPFEMTTHGGRPRAVLSGELPIDIAFIAAPTVGREGEISGSEGPSACGSLGYAVADAECAKCVVAVTDHYVEAVSDPDIRAGLVDEIIWVDRIGDPAGIVSGTTKITKDPIGLKIARDTARLMRKVGVIKQGMSMQTGAGGISLAVADEVKRLMQAQLIRGRFGCGGITGFFTDMLDEGLFERLYDVQCFDIAAVRSSGTNADHQKISASRYANPDDDCIVEKLDCVILGASEIDLDFNVNVTTGSDGRLLGGSGGHADTAAGAGLTIITTKLINARVSAVVDAVRTVTTPGETVDVLVTEYGIAVNPRRADLIERLEGDPTLTLCSIDELYEQAIRLTGTPKKRPRSGEIIGYSIYRDGTILDGIDRVEV